MSNEYLEAKQHAEQLALTYKTNADLLAHDKAELNQKINALKKEFQAKKEQYTMLMHNAKSDLKSFARKYRSQFDGKQLDLDSCNIGFRLKNPELKAAKGTSLKKQLPKIQELFPECIITKPKLDKHSIIAHRDDEGMEAKLSEAGIKIAQKETFYCDVK